MAEEKESENKRESEEPMREGQVGSTQVLSGTVSGPLGENDLFV